jgi:hypothetical protein
VYWSTLMVTCDDRGHVECYDVMNRTLYWLGKCAQKGCRPSIERRPTAAPGTVQTYPHLKGNGRVSGGTSMADRLFGSYSCT